MRRYAGAVFAVGAFLLSTSTLAAQAGAIVEGRVREIGTDQGIQNAIVELRGYSATLTGSAGTFVFRGVKPGQYSLRVTAFGYASHDKSLVVSENTTLDIALDIAPIPLVGVTGRHVDVEGRIWAPGREFFMTDAEVWTDLGEVASTDAHGRFRLKNVAEEVPIRVSVRAFGYLPVDSVIVPVEDGRYDFELETDSLTAAMIDVQVQRIEKRLGPRRAILFRSMDRERLLRYAGPHTLRSAMEFEYSQMLLRRVRCVYIDERALSVMTTLTVLGTMLPEEVERIEFTGGRSEVLVRIYTRAFMQDMVSRHVELRDLSLSPICPP